MVKRRNHSFQFKISLKGLRPPIWRRILVPSSYSFWDLHVAIQDAMGWLDFHLHLFRIRSPTDGKRAEIGIPLDDPFSDLPEPLAGWSVPVASYFTLSNRKATYLYDFGDGWEHSVVLEEIAPRADTSILPMCLAGRRRCPPEDCGGNGGYEHFLEIIGDASHEEHADALTWVGGSFDPGQFERASIQFDDPRSRWQRAFRAEPGESKTAPVRVGVDERIPVVISLEDRQLIVEHTFADPDLVDRLLISEIRDGELRVGYTLSELDELQGFIAAELNHTGDAALRWKLDALYQKLQATEDLYENELSPGVN